MRTLTTLITLILLAGCNLNTPADAVRIPITPTVPNIRIVAQQTTNTPVPTREMRPISTSTSVPTPEPTAFAYNCNLPERDFRAEHTVVANIDYDDRVADVLQSTRYLNTTEFPLSDIVLNIEANDSAEVFQMGVIKINGQDMVYDLRLNHLTLQLPLPLPQNCEVVLEMTFRVSPPRIGAGITAFKGYLGWSDRQLNLGYWLPSVSPRVNDRWIKHDPTILGEQVALEQAIWDVTLNVANANGDLRIAAPGVATELGENQWRYMFTGGRDFVVSMSENFVVLQKTALSGAIVEAYVFPDAIRSTEQGIQDGGQHALDEAVLALQLYESIFGPYPYGRLAIVQGDFPDGMEFSGLVFVSTNWFYNWKGGVENYLTIITVHEVAHQWWYAQVGNDAAISPWLDEALATYSEYIYYEEYYPDLRSWWWSFRVAGFSPTGAVDGTVYEFDSPRAYINAVYLRGAQMLQNLREDIGEDAFFALLNNYAKQASEGIVTPDVFWSLLTPEQLERTIGTRNEFFRDPNFDVTNP
jgi:hypothetical protein